MVALCRSQLVSRMAAAACGVRGCPRANTAKPLKDHSRKSRDSRRRQAALLFLNNISLDGRPVYNLNNGVVGPREVDVGALTGPSTSSSSYGTFTQVSVSISGSATPLPRTNAHPAPLSPPTCSQGTSDVFTDDARTDPLSGPPLSPTSGPLNPFSGASKSPIQLPGPDPRQRCVQFQPDRRISIGNKCSVHHPSFAFVL